MSTLDISTYTPVSVGLFNYGGGPESIILRRLTASALEQLAFHSGAQAALNDLFTLQQEARVEPDSPELTAETLEIGKRFLLAWPKALPMPELALDTDGEVVFDWTAPHGRRMISVSLRSDGRISYACQLGARRTAHGTEAFDDAVPGPIVEAVKSLYAA